MPCSNLLLEEELDTKFDESYYSLRHKRWVRVGDGSKCCPPDRAIIEALLGVQLMDSAKALSDDGKEITRYNFTDKARRMRTARKAKSPTLTTPDSAEYCWLVMHENRGKKQVYPYLGAEPPDIGDLLEPGWAPTPNIDTFHVRCLPLNVWLRISELFLESTAVSTASA